MTVIVERKNGDRELFEHRVEDYRVSWGSCQYVGQFRPFDFGFEVDELVDTLKINRRVFEVRGSDDGVVIDEVSCDMVAYYRSTQWATVRHE